MAHDVFVSYPNEDKGTADAVVATLEGRGLRCWVAPRDVPPGVDWAGAIIEAISRSSLMVLVFSDAANSSEHILREVREAADAGIAIMPFRTTDTEPSPALKYYIGGTHWLDALSDSLETHLSELADRVVELLAEPPPEGDPDVVRPSPVRPTQPVLAVSPLVVKVIGGVAVAAALGALGLWMFGSGGDEVEGEDGVAAATITVPDPTTTSAGEVVSTPANAEEPNAPSPTTSLPEDVVLGTAGTPVPIPIDMEPAVLAIANVAGEGRLCLSIGNGTLACEVIGSEGGVLTDAALADLDGDGRIDAAFSARGPGTDGHRPAPNIWCRNTGQGWDCSEFPGPAYQSESVVAADVGDDGRIEVIFGNDATTLPLEEYGRAQVCWGRVVIGFECEPLPSTLIDQGEHGDTPGSIRSVRDVGVGDLFFSPDGTQPSSIVLLAGYNRGEVCAPGQRVSKNCFELVGGEGYYTAVAIGDFNSDQVPDFIMGSEGPSSYLCFQGNPGGPGSYECYSPAELADGVQSAAAGDIDNDGKLDVVFAMSSGGVPALLCLGDGAGALACSELAGSASSVIADIQIGDLNGDGSLDLLLLNERHLEVCSGNGDGTFQCEMIGDEALLLGGTSSDTWQPDGLAWAPVR